MISAEAALERGDYGQCLALLKEIEKKYPITTKEGSEIRMLMVTALMGQGNDKQALSLCRLLTHCKNDDIRESAKQLLSVLEAPSLPRQSNWSIKLPSIETTVISGKQINFGSNKTSKKQISKHPPTGPTKALDMGFSLIVLSILLLLTLILSGCIRINTEVEIAGPDLINMNWEIESNTKQILPWQIDFEDSIKNEITNINSTRDSKGMQKLKTKSLTSKEANLVLKQTFRVAADSAGFDINSPELILEEENFFIFIQQKLKLFIDLRDIPRVPGIEMNVIVKSNSKSNNTPLINQSLIQGEQNIIELETWRLNPLGIGLILILILLLISQILQTLRLKLGFGFPELPP